MLAAGCQSPARTAGQPGRAPLLEGMGDHQRAVSTSDELAQRYFNQGLTLAYAFNHDEAIRSFEEAARLDRRCAMAWWGIALCSGPHINNPIVTEERARAAWRALEEAQALQAGETPANQALIRAMARRFSADPAAERRPLDEAYAAAMGDVYRDFPNDADVGTLYAESLMDLRPWDLWGPGGEPRPETPVILAALEGAMARAPRHPGALHLYVHAIEASPHPEKANAAADGLRNLVPGAGHLVHMPSHIDVLTGRWAQAVTQNKQAIAADRRYRAISPRQGFYHVYMAHNHHMMAFAAMMQGNSTIAISAAREMVEGVPPEYVRESAVLVDPFMMIVPEVLMRFGRWDDILREPRPPDHLPISTALWHFTRGVAWAAKGQLDKAEAERAAFAAAAAKVPADALMSINPAHRILDIARHVLDGEIAYRRGDLDAAIAELQIAVSLEDQLLYMEPPEWIQPVRHTLGAILLQAGRAGEAEQVYRVDLEEWPENGWSLYGLTRALEQRGAATEARAAQERFAKAWSNADAPIHASCLCVTGRAQQ
jgi:tetratricopeptide (TPR) repeat protein